MGKEKQKEVYECGHCGQSFTKTHTCPAIQTMGIVAPAHNRINQTKQSN